MKFYVRRFIVAVVTLPIVFTVYAALYFGIGLLTMADDITAYVPIGPYLYNLPAIGFGYVVTIMLLPQIYNLVDRLTD
jgi:hypothetical protein